MRRLLMLDRFSRRLFAGRLFADPRSTPALLRRLLTEQARAHWRRYGLVVVLMAVGAACTALPPWLLGRGIDSTYVYRSFDSLAFIATAMMVIFALKWVTSYAQSVSMAASPIASSPRASPRWGCRCPRPNRRTCSSACR